MSISQTAICNRALIRIGADTITSIDEDSKEARIMNILYDQVRQELLRSHIWNFALRREILAADSTSPDFQWLFQYPLPADCLRVVGLHDPISVFKVENGKIMSDDDGIYLIYISDVEDPQEFDVTFITMFSLKLALEAAYNLTNSTTLTNQLQQEFIIARREAKQYDAQEGIPDTWANFDWIDIR